MTATLTIKAEAAGAVSVLEGVNRLIDGSVKASERLAAVTATIRGHWSNISNDLSGILRQVQAVAQATQQVAGAANYTHAGFLSSLGAAQRLSAELSKIRADAIQAARAMNGIRPQGGGFGGSTFTGGTGGFTFTPTPSFTPAPLPTPTRPALTNSGGSSGSAGGQIMSAIGSAAGAVTSTIGSALEMAWDGFKKGALAASAVASTIVGNSVRLALQAEPIAGGFSALTQSKGLGDETKVLKELREAAKGTVSDLQLMTNANAAMQLGAASTSEELQLLIEGGRRLGKAMGRDATEGFRDLATGIGRQSRLILDNLGIVIKSDEVYEKYAKSVGTTAEALSDSEKRLVFQKAAFEAVRQKMADLGEEQDTTGDKIGRFKTQFSNLSVELGNRFLPAIGEVADKWASFLGSFKEGEIAQAFTNGFEAFKTVQKSIAEFIYPKDLVDDVANIGSDVWRAFTDPSKEAFEVIGLRLKQLWVDAKADILNLWEDVKAIVTQSAAGLTGVIGGMLPSGLGGDYLEGKAGIKIGQQMLEKYRNKSANESQRAEDKSGIQAQIDALNAIIANRPETGSLASATSTTATGGSSNAAMLATERAKREAAEATAKAEREAIEATRQALQKEIRAREEVVHTLERENRLVEDRMRDIESARANASAALAGLANPNETVATQLNELAGELRRYPETFQRIGQKIDENGKAMAESMKDWTESIEKNLSDLDRGIRQQAQSFLQEGPQDGETVRVRSLKRRAQRDLRRENTASINDAFRSPSIDSFGVSSMFGAQGIERSGSVLNQRFPGLEKALLGLRNNDGTTQVQQITERITGLVEDHAKQLQKQQERQAELLREQTAAHEQQKNTQAATNELLKKAVDDYVSLSAAFSSQQKQIDGLKRDLERAAQQVRSLK